MCRKAVTAARRRWKPHRLAVDLSDTTASARHTVDVVWPTPTTNHTAYRPPRSRSKPVVSLVDHSRGRGAVLSVAGLPAPSHPSRSVQRLVDGMLVTVLGVFVVAVVAAVSLARRRRRAVTAAARSCDDEYVTDDDCVELGEFVTVELGEFITVELGEFVTELNESSPDDSDAPPPALGSPTAEYWNVDDEEDPEHGDDLVLADVTSLTPLCARSSSSSAASSVTDCSTPPDTPT